MKQKRITKTRILKLFNEMLDRLEIDWVGVKIEKSRFRGCDYEGGAWVWRVEIKRKNGEETIRPFYLYCHLPWREFQGVIDGTHMMSLYDSARNGLKLLNNYEIWYIKK